MELQTPTETAHGAGRIEARIDQAGMMLAGGTGTETLTESASATGALTDIGIETGSGKRTGAGTGQETLRRIGPAASPGTVTDHHPKVQKSLMLG
jgi:hypothetical protein